MNRRLPSPRMLVQDQRGMAAVELALIAPVLALLLLGASDIAMAVAAKLRVQQAASRAIEMVNVGGLSGAAYQNLKAEAASAAGVASGQVTLDNWLECDGVRQSDFNATCASGAQTARFVSLVVSGSYTPMFDIAFRALNLSQNGRVTLNGKSSVRLQ